MFGRRPTVDGGRPRSHGDSPDWRRRSKVPAPVAPTHDGRSPIRAKPLSPTRGERAPGRVAVWTICVISWLHRPSPAPLHRRGITSAMVFVGVGFVAGASGLGLLDVSLQSTAAERVTSPPWSPRCSATLPASTCASVGTTRAAVPAAADRASADDGVRSRRRAFSPFPGMAVASALPLSTTPSLDRCCPGRARRRRHGGARAGAPGPGRGERPERRTGGPVLPGGHGHHNGNLGEGRSSRGPPQCRGTDRLGCAGRNGRVPSWEGLSSVSRTDAAGCRTSGDRCSPSLSRWRLMHCPGNWGPGGPRSRRSSWAWRSVPSHTSTGCG